MDIKLILKLSDLSQIILDWKAGLIDEKQARQKIFEIGCEMELIESGQKVIDLDKEK